MIIKKFKVGDWVFCEFVLQQIKEMNGDLVTQVTDGQFTLSSSDLNDRCFHLDLTIKNLSDAVKYWSKQFHSCKQNLNHPDLNRELIRRWVELCENKNKEENLDILIEDLDNFGRLVMKKSRDLDDEFVGNIKLFR